MMQIHVTAVGETLFSIAQTYNTTPELLALYNGLPLETPLVPGQALLILIPEKSVIVQPGDTVSVIAARAGLSVNELYRKNPQLHGLPDLYPGQRLTLSYTESPVGTLSVSGYAYPNIELSLLRETLPFLTYLIPFTYGFTGTGTLVLPEDALLRDLAAQYSVDTLLHLSSLGPDGTFSSSRAAMLLQNPDLQ